MDKEGDIDIRYIILIGFIISVFFIFLVEIGFVSAPHTVTTSTGATSYNINEDTVYVFNITINNTNAENSANITQVNITLPSGFTFAAQSNGTNALDPATFSNTTTVLTWTNNTRLINATINNTNFWFNISVATPGDYNITVTTLNTTGLYYFNSNISVHVNDTTRPSVIITNPATNGTNYSTSSFNFSLRLSDNINISSCWFTLTSGVNNYTMTVNASKTGANYTNESIADGTYTSKFYCNDTSNNLNGTELTTLTIDTTLPVVTLISPADGATGQNPSFNVSFNVTDDSLINCSLVLNGAIINNLISANRTGGTNSFVNLSYIATNTWSVNCTDNANNKANSTTRTFTLTSFQFNGTVKDEIGNAINNSLVNITIRNQNTWGIVGYASTTSNASGWFNITLASNVSWIYSPSMIQRNSTYNHVDYVSKTIPPFPSTMMAFLAGANFYLTEAGTINITAINITGFNNRTTFQYEIKDTKLGYPIVSDHVNYASEVVVYVPKNRNYSIMIYPNQNMPVSFEWTNFSATSSYNHSTGGSLFLSNYNVTTKTLNKQFNISSSRVSVYGYAMNIVGNASAVNFTNFTVIPFLVESGNMVHATYGDLPHGLNTSFGVPENHTSLGYYNISLPGTAESSTILLFASAVGNISNKSYGGFRNITPGYGMAPQSINFTMYELLGNSTTMSLDEMQGGSFLVPMNVMNFTLVNVTNSSLGSIAAHVEMTVNYTDYGAFGFTWMTDVAQSSAVASFAIPMINATGFEEMNVYVSGGPSGGNGQYAPVKLTKRTSAQIQSNSNITIRTFNPQALDGTVGSSISIALYISNSTCDRPNPTAGCNLTGSGDMATFNPMGAVMGGGKISFRMGIGGVLVHYVNVDLMASGPPDALFEDNNDVTEGTSGSFSKAMKFGSGGPTIYDYILISLPYTEGSSTTTGLQETMDVNLSIPTFYGENTDGSMNWNTPIWSSSNGTNATNLARNYSHYSASLNDWQTLMNVNNCTKTETSLSASTPCFVDLTNNRIWVRLPHFTGTTPSITGGVVSASSSTSSGSSSGTGGVETIYTVTPAQLENGYSKLLLINNKLKMNISGEWHYAKLTEVTANSATIEVSSTPQSKTLLVGDLRKFDVNEDDYYDLSVKLNSIGKKKANITVKSIYEKVTVASEEEEQEKETKAEEKKIEDTEKKGNTIWLWVLVIIIVAIVGGVIYWFMRSSSGVSKVRRRY